jgi:hypothetical protein
MRKHSHSSVPEIGIAKDFRRDKDTSAESMNVITVSVSYPEEPPNGPCCREGENSSHGGCGYGGAQGGD